MFAALSALMTSAWLSCGVEHDRLQKPFDVGRKLFELVIGEHRKQMDGQLTHPACASPRTLSAPACPSGVAFILESRDPSEDFPFGSDQVFEALPERERPTGPP